MSILTLAAGTGLAQEPPDPAGTWLGTLTFPGAQLRLVLNVTRGSDGALAATMDSPDQGATGIPVSSVTLEGRSFRAEVSAIGGVYAGTMGEDGRTMEGTWSQGGQSFPLDMSRTEGEVERPARPQEPTEPFPYHVEEVRYPNQAAEIEIAGTLTMPDERPVAAVVLISGSGPQDRDETVFGHRPFLVLADDLTRRGIAVLRFDDRGVGGSSGSFSGATSRDFAGDVRAGVAFLKSRSDLEGVPVGLVGHSEGGLIAPLVAVETPGVAFIVLLAGPGVRGREILEMQGALIARASGASEETVELNRRTQQRMFEVLASEPDDARARPRLEAVLRETLDGLSPGEWRAMGVTAENRDQWIASQVNQTVSPWFRFFLEYDPAATLRRVGVPVLALNGEKDLQVPPSQNLPAIERALRDGGNEDFTVRELPGLNHLFQPSTTGAPAEYAGIETTFDPAALTAIGEWILARTR